MLSYTRVYMLMETLALVLVGCSISGETERWVFGICITGKSLINPDPRTVRPESAETDPNREQTPHKSHMSGSATWTQVTIWRPLTFPLPTPSSCTQKQSISWAGCHILNPRGWTHSMVPCESHKEVNYLSLINPLLSFHCRKKKKNQTREMPSTDEWHYTCWSLYSKKSKLNLL